MAFRFQSRETADLVMLKRDAERLLNLLGKDASAPGVITWPEMPGAIARLQAEATLEQQTPEPQGSDGLDQEGAVDFPNGDRSGAVLLHQRIAPLVGAMRRCHAAQKDLIWTF